MRLRKLASSILLMSFIAGIVLNDVSNNRKSKIAKEKVVLNSGLIAKSKS